MANPYEDIIDLPHHVSDKRARMSARDRAAQFSPFAALTGYEAAVEETARLTNQRIELDESRKEALSRQLLTLAEEKDGQPQVTITYFVPDKRKAGGEYVTATGCIKKIDKYENLVLLTDGGKIPIPDIYTVESNENVPLSDI